MKKCSYCGAEYPDDAKMCAIDRTLLDGSFQEDHLETSPFKLPEFGVFSENKIPTSLTIASYFFFLPGAGLLAGVSFLIFGLIYISAIPWRGDILLPSLVSVALGILITVCLIVFPIAMFFGCIVFAVLMATYSSGVTGLHENILYVLFGAAYGIVSVYLSRGLRRCSRGWRTCALALIWWDFIMIEFAFVQYFLTHKNSHEKTTPIELLLEIASVALTIGIPLWQYRVLTRPDIRDLFGE